MYGFLFTFFVTLFIMLILNFLGQVLIVNKKSDNKIKKFILLFGMSFITSILLTWVL